MAVGLALLGAVNPAESYTLRMLVVQDFEGVAVEDMNDLAGEVSSKDSGGKLTQTRKLPQRVRVALRRSPRLLESMSVVGRSSQELLLHGLE